MVFDAKRSSTTCRNPVAAAALTLERANECSTPTFRKHIKVQRLPELFGEPFQLCRVSGSSATHVHARSHEAVLMMNGFPPPGPLLIHTLLDWR
jgi:hypothetical protein